MKLQTPIPHFYKSIGENWFTYPELYRQAVISAPQSAHFVEVGTWKGRSAVYMAVEIANSGKSIRFDCVDSWEYLESQKEIEPAKFSGLYELFLANIEPVKEYINPVRAISWVAAERYSNDSLDFVFIDAGHDYASVKKDVKAWLPKVKQGGVLAGHDYAWSASVKMAVNEILGPEKITEQEGCWIYNV